MRITRPRATKLSQIAIDADLVMGAHDITLGAGQLVDGKDVSTLDIGDMEKAVYDPNEDGVIALAQLDPNIAKVTEGSYAGDAADDRAIAHGLGKIPQIVIIQGVGTVKGIWFISEGQAIIMDIDTQMAETACTLWMDTYFYTEASYTARAINKVGGTYHWTAIG